MDVFELSASPRPPSPPALEELSSDVREYYCNPRKHVARSGDIVEKPRKRQRREEPVQDPVVNLADPEPPVVVDENAERLAALQKFADSKAYFPSDGTIEGCGDITLVVDLLAKCFKSHHRASTQLLLKVGQAMSRHNMSVIRAWYSHETVCSLAVSFATTAQGDAIEKVIVAFTSLLCFELEAPGGFVLEDHHLRRTAVWNLASGEGGIGKLLANYFSYIDTLEQHAQRKSMKPVMPLFDLHITLLRQPAGTTLPHLRGLWNVYRPFVSRALTQFVESDLFWSSLAQTIFYKFRAHPISTKNGSLDEGSSRFVAMLSVLVKHNALSDGFMSPVLKMLEIEEVKKSEHQKAITDDIFFGIVKQIAKSASKPHVRFAEAHFDNDIQVIKSILASTVVQSRILEYHEPSVKDEFLPAVEQLIISVGTLCPFPSSTDPLKLAQTSGIGCKNERLDSPMDIEPGDTSTAENVVQNGIALVVSILSSFVKSYSTGDRKLFCNNTLRAFLNARSRDEQNLSRLYDAVFRIRRSADPEAFSEQELSAFATAVELFRLELISSSEKNRRLGEQGSVRHIAQQLAGRDLEERVASETPEQPNETKVVFPPLLSSKEISGVVANIGHRDFDDDPHNLRHVGSVLKRSAESQLSRYDPKFHKPSRWVRLSRNVYVGDARSQLAKDERIYPGRCNCIPRIVAGQNSDSPICCASGMCENVATKVECDPRKCAGGKACRNQQMQRDVCPSFKMARCGEKGMGLIADEFLEAHRYLGEYRGEVVTPEEFKRREELYVGERHFYAMTLTPRLTIDASRKSAITRFINHSCDPNAEAQKWVAGGEPRIALFAKRPIAKGEEVTFNYAALSGGLKAKACLCGTAKCQKTLTQSRRETESDVTNLASLPNDMVQGARQKLEEGNGLRMKARNAKVFVKTESTSDLFLKWKAAFEKRDPRFTDRHHSVFRIPRISVAAAKAKEAAMEPTGPSAGTSQRAPRYTRLVVSSQGPNRFGPGPISKEEAAELNKPQPLRQDLDWGTSHPPGKRVLAPTAPMKTEKKEDENALRPWRPPKTAPGGRVFQITERDVATGRVVIEDVVPKPRDVYDSDYSDVSETVPVFSDDEDMLDAECGDGVAGTDDEFDEAPPIEQVVAAQLAGPASPLALSGDGKVDKHPPRSPSSCRNPHPPPAPVHPGRAYEDSRPYPTANGVVEPHADHYRQPGHHRPGHTRYNQHGDHHDRGHGPPPRDGRTWGRDSYDPCVQPPRRHSRGHGPWERNRPHQHSPHQHHPPQNATVHHPRVNAPPPHERGRDSYHKARPVHRGRANGPGSRDHFHQDHGRNFHGHRDSRRNSFPFSGRYSQEHGRHSFSRGASGSVPPQQRHQRQFRNHRGFGTSGHLPTQAPHRNPGRNRDFDNRSAADPSVGPPSS